MGKTTLLKHFSNVAANERKVCLVESTATLQPHQFFASLGRCFGISDQRAGLQEIVQSLEDLDNRGIGRQPIVLVDDADQLPISTFITLLRLYEQHSKDKQLIRLVLFARPQIDLLLKTSQIQAMNLQMIQALYLYPMSKARMEHFIQFLIQQMDFAGPFRISQSQIKKIYRTSGGNPARVLFELRQLRYRNSKGDAYKRKGRLLLANLSVPRIFSGVLIAALIVIGVVFQNQINEQSLETQDMKSPPQTTLKTKINNIQSDLSLTPPPPLESQLVLLDPLHGTSNATSVSEPEIAPKATEADQLKTPEIIEKKIYRELLANRLPGTLKVKAKQQSESQPLADEAATQPEPKTRGEDSSALVETISILKISEQLNPQIVQDDNSQVLKSQQISTTLSQSAKFDGTLLAPLRESWLLAQKPTLYTLQVVAMRNEDGIKKFIKKHQLSGQIAYFRDIKDDAPWFSVLYGFYPNKKKAKAAIITLPQALQKSGVWVRSLKSIHMQLKKG